MFISPQDMEQLIHARRAEPSLLDVDLPVPPIVRMDGTWYVLRVGAPGYEPASDSEAEKLTEGLNDLTGLDTAIDTAKTVEEAQQRLWVLGEDEQQTGPS